MFLNKFLIGFLLSFTGYIFLLPILNKFNLEKPNERSLHFHPTPSGGGLIFLLSLLVTSFLTKEIYFLPLIFLSLIGYLDDLFSLKRKYRFVFQLIISIFILIMSPFFESINNNNNLFIFLIILFLIFFSTGIINFFNFMDGIDGLLAGCSLIIFFTMSISTEIEIISFLGSIAAFLIFNWSPAKLFMGDAGSTLLGGLFLIFVLQATNIQEIIRILLISTPLLADAIFCVFRRFADKQNIFQAHKLHLYQRLVSAGIKENVVTSIYMLATLLLSILYLYSNTFVLSMMALLILIIGYILDNNFAISFKNS